MKYRQPAFVAVLVIMGTLCLLAFFKTSKSDSQRKNALLDLKHLVSALAIYRREFAAYPVDYAKSLIYENYIDAQQCVDPWGTPYSYSLSIDGTSYTLLSLGADGRAGGSGLNADIPSSMALVPLPPLRLHHALLLISMVSFFPVAAILLRQYVFLPLQRRARVRRGLCPRCRYDLSGTSDGPCPECGWSQTLAC